MAVPVFLLVEVVPSAPMPMGSALIRQRPKTRLRPLRTAWTTRMRDAEDDPQNLAIRHPAVWAVVAGVLGFAWGIYFFHDLRPSVIGGIAVGLISASLAREDSSLAKRLRQKIRDDDAEAEARKRRKSGSSES